MLRWVRQDGHNHQSGYAERDEAWFAGAWAEGQAMTLEQAITYALSTATFP
ncbi:MAG: hypothetical protein M3380_12740 [Chloroflexota bacterium]|nr:hypothetical protein [Chloroflexota bacterium]